ncbi:MAG: methionyl aminopeptidase [Patescibacteria group bacterium]|jgi:methionyl aminopeptidase|nr:methionyl aminopeptidase [Patescibacteria group bacterium]
MITIKTKEDIEKLREGGKRHAEILRKVSEMVAPGVTTKELDEYAHRLIIEGGDTPAFLNYTPEGVSYPYPASLCVSVNDEIVHGIPSDFVLEEGDIVSLDLGLVHKGMITDSAITVPCGHVSKDVQKLLEVTKGALNVAIKNIKPGNKTGDVGHAIEEFVKPYGFGIVKILAGHGVGYSVHEDPYVPNYGKPGTGEELRPGMVLAIEPMLNLGTDEVYVTEDEYTYITADGKKSAHFEHTVVVTEEGCEVLTK